MTVTTTSTSRTSPSPAEREALKPKKPRFRGFDDPEYYKDPRNASISNFVRLGPNNSWLTRAEYENNEILGRARALGPDVYASMQDVLRGAPTVSPGMAVALAMMGAGSGATERLTPEIRDRILALDTTAQAMDPERPDVGRRPAPGSEAERRISLMRLVKAIARPAFAALSMPQEAVIGGIRGVVGALSEEEGPDWSEAAWNLGGILPPVAAIGEARGEYSRPNPYEQTLGGQMIIDRFDESDTFRDIFNVETPATEGVDMGDGFFVGGDVASRQRIAARSAAPLVGDHAWTLGRGSASLVFEDTDRMAYKTLSGVIDFAAVLLLDPTILGAKFTATGKGLRAGVRARELTQAVDPAEAQLITREAARLADDAGQYVRDTIVLHEDTTAAARDLVAAQQRLAAEAHRVSQSAVDPTEAATLAARRDELLDAADLAKRDLDEAKRQVVSSGGAVDASGRPRVGEARLPDAELRAAIDEVSMTLGDEGLDSMMARAVGLALPVPGQFTDAVFSATKRRSNRPNLLPGAVDGKDGLVGWTGPKPPVLASVDDPIEEADEIVAAFRGSLGGRSNQRKAAVRELTDLVTSPGATWGDLIERAIATGMGTQLYRVLLSSRIDGITDIFRLKGGENGVWWTSRQVEGMPWSRAGWERGVNLRADALERAKTARAELTQVRKELTALEKKKRAYVIAADMAAGSVARGVDNLTSLADEGEALRNVLSYGFGVSRDVSGSPVINYDALQAALFGQTSRLDDLLGTAQQISTGTRVGEAFGRSTLALATLGASEVGRAATKVVRGAVVTPARQRALQAMVNSTEKDLGLLQRLTRGKVDNESLVAISRAESEEEVLEILAPMLGMRVGTPLTGNPLGAGRMGTSRVGHKVPDVLWTRALDWLNKAATVLPRAGTHLNYSDPDGSTQMLRQFLTATGMTPAKVDEVLTPYIRAESEPGRARAAMDAMRSLADDLGERNAGFDEATREMLNDALKKATSIYQGGVAEVNNWWRPRYAHDAHLGYVTVDGRRIELPGPQLEAELARGGTALPDPMEIRAAYGRWGRALTQHPNLHRVRDAAEKGMDLWRSAMLIRPAYIWRNIGEMQIRMQLAGHQSLFSSPLNHMLMAWSMNPNAGAMRRMAARFARYNRTALGTKLEVPRGGDIDDYEETLQEFAELMTRHGSFHDMRTYRNATRLGGIEIVRVDQPDFVRGWADQMMMLHSSRLARIVAGEDVPFIADAVAQGMDRQAAVMYWLRNHPTARTVRTELEEAGPAFRQILADDQALRQYLFEGPSSIAARLDETTAKIPELMDFIRTGRLVDPKTGQPTFTYRTSGDAIKRQQDMEARTQNFGKALTAGGFKARLPEDYRITARVAKQSKPGDVPNRLSSWFFNWAGKLERAHAVGPEFAASYWDRVADLMPAMTKSARAQVYEEAKRQAGLLGQGNINLVKIRKAMGMEEGSLIVEDVHRVASRDASEAVERLFYDAAKRQQFWHATRMALPFAQATYNTFSTWGRLMATKPVQAYKVGRALNAAQETGSNVVYDIYDAVDPFGGTYDHDPAQGFLYREPGSDELVFKFPIAGSVMGAVLAPVIGYNLPEAQTLTASASSLNLALQGKVDFLPGAGPLVSIPASAIMPDDWYGTVPDTLRDWLFPFGEPQTDAGVLESQMPSWARRFFLGALGPGAQGEQFRAYSYKGAMAYVASSREWPGLTEDPLVQAEYLREVDKVARAMTAIRGIGAFVLPAAPMQDIYTQDKDGTLISMTLLGSYWNQIGEAYPGDFERQLTTFMDMFGEDAIQGIVSSSEGERSISGPGWEFQKQHSEEARAHSKVLGVFFPGDFSQEAFRWQQQTERRRRLSPEEREDQAIRYLYAARRAKIEENAARYEWDNETLDEALRALVEEEFGGVAPPYTGTDAATLDDIRRALRTAPNLARTRGGQGAELLFEAYDEYTDMAQERYGVGLRAKKAEALRMAFLDEVNLITSQYALIPGQEVQGSVDSIAQMFIREVQPRS